MKLLDSRLVSVGANTFDVHFVGLRGRRVSVSLFLHGVPQIRRAGSN
jgi:hypothetical protein